MQPDMVGTKGKGSRSKSKSTGGAVVPADPEPLNCPPSDGEEDNEISNRLVIRREDEGTDELIADDGVDEEGCIGVKGNDKEEVFATEMEDIMHDKLENLCTDADEEGNMKVSDGFDAFTNADAETNNEITIGEKPHEEDLVDFGINNEIMNEEDLEEENIVDSGTNNELMNEEELEEEEEDDLMYNRPDLITSNGQKSPEDTTGGSGINNETEGVANNNEGMPSFEDILDQRINDFLLHYGKVSEPKDEQPVSVLPDNGGKNSAEGTASAANGVKAVVKRVNQPRRKTTRRKLVKKKVTTTEMQPSDGIDKSVESSKAGASNEAKPQSSVGKEALGEACQEDKTEHVENEKSEVRSIVKVSRKLKRLRKKVPQGNSGPSGVVAPRDEHVLKNTNDEPESKENNQSVEKDIKNEGIEKSEDKASHLKKRKRKKLMKKGAQKVNANGVDSSKKGKLSRRIESMGMIFMCSSQTKKDCYQYKVLGLPAAKKDLVSKIYKGMRLFLFDLDLKMLYGIYRAAGPGGYDIEPRAFKSKFPSQVRFTVLEDCLPLAEEKFKNVIKDNYYTKNKFHCELTNEQVKNLSKLFHETTKKAGSILDAGVRSTVASSSAQLDRKRKRMKDKLRVVPVPVSTSERKRSRRRVQEEVRHAPLVTERGHRRAQEEARHAPLVAERSHRRDQSSHRRAQEEARHVSLVAERSKRRTQEEVRRVTMVTDDRYHQPVIVYDTETYLPSVASASLYQPLRAEDPLPTRPLYQTLRAEDPHTRPLYQPLRIEDAPHNRSYTYERAAEVDTYRRDYRDPIYPSSQELRYTVERDRNGPYVSHSEPHVYREPEYLTDNGREHYNYPSDVRYIENYGSVDYRPSLPLYRRY